MSTPDRRDAKRAKDQRLWQGDDDGEMDRDDNRARGDRSLSEPRGSSVGHVLLSDAPRVCAAQAIGTGVKFRYRIGGPAATDEWPHELREQGQMASGAVAPAELDLRLRLSEGAMTFLLSMLAQEAKVRICLVELPLGRGASTSPGLALASDGRPAKWKNDRL
jgi:hypothetical protein